MHWMFPSAGNATQTIIFGMFCFYFQLKLLYFRNECELCLTIVMDLNISRTSDGSICPSNFHLQLPWTHSFFIIGMVATGESILRVGILRVLKACRVFDMIELELELLCVWKLSTFCFLDPSSSGEQIIKKKQNMFLPFKIKSYPVSVNQASSRETCKLIQMAVCLTSVWFLEANNYMVATYLWQKQDDRQAEGGLRNY